MPDLGPQTAAAFCAAMGPALSIELRVAAACHDVSGQHLQWDLEARDASGRVLRRVSCVRAVSQRFMQAMAQTGDEVWTELERELRKLGLFDCSVSFGIRELPPKKSPARAELIQGLAARIRVHLRNGAVIIEDPTVCLMQGRHPWADPIAAAFYDVSARKTPGTGPAKVVAASADALTTSEPTLVALVLPVIAEKQKKHKDLVSDLTLVVQVFDRSWTSADLAEVRNGLATEHRGFKSAYIARSLTGAPADVDRLY